MIDPKIVKIFCNVFEIDKSLINYGWCYNFALVIQKIYGGEFISTCDHAWIKIGKKHYDSENLKGLTKPQGDMYTCNCLYCKFCPKNGKGKVINEKRFISHWDKNGGSGPVQLEKIDIVVNTILAYNRKKVA